MLVVLLSLMAVTAADRDVPTDGDLMRELAEDETARLEADLNADGFISDMEFDVYKRKRQQLSAEDFADVRKPRRDPNRVGDTADSFEPCELFVEAKCLGTSGKGGKGKKSKDCERTDGYYYIDDRDGTVYCPEY